MYLQTTFRISSLWAEHLHKEGTKKKYIYRKELVVPQLKKINTFDHRTQKGGRLTHYLSLIVRCYGQRTMNKVYTAEHAVPDPCSEVQ